MRAWLVLAAVAAAGSALAQQPGQTPASAKPPPVLITNPDWEHKPGPDEFSRFAPVGVSSTGLVTVQCDVIAQGATAGCVVLEENPPNEGFGAAALKIAPYFKMKPKTLDGKPVGGGMFITRIRFVEDDTPIPDWARHPTDAQIEAVWPDQARGIAGQVVLECNTTMEGLVSRCRIHKETPGGMGFGVAALKLTNDIQLTVGSQVGVLIPISFRLPAPKQVGVAEFGGSLSALSNAPWLAAPLATDVAAAWPGSAPRDLREAQVRLSCGLQPDGLLGPCTILSEEPPGLGFGPAALALTHRFQLRGDMNPDVLKKARVILPVTFENPAMSRQTPERLTQPNWVTYIDQDRMTQLYPAKAADTGVKTGRGVVNCTVAAGGKLTGCTVESEDPPGLGFGESAVAVLASFTVNPWTDDGHPVDGSLVHLPVRMNEAEPAPAASPPAPAAPAKPGD